MLVSIVGTGVFCWYWCPNVGTGVLNNGNDHLTLVMLS